MAVSNTARFEHLSNGQDDACYPAPGWADAMRKAAEESGNGTAGQASSGTQTASSRVNEAADERAFRLRSAGHTYRQIGDEMGVDASMAHRRVKRHALRQKMYRDEKLEEARELEFEKMRQMEKALLPDATDGDHASIKLVLRIMELRRKYLKDIPLDRGERVPAMEERAELLAEVVNEESESQGRPEDADWTVEEEERCWDDIAALGKGGDRVEGSKSRRVEERSDPSADSATDDQPAGSKGGQAADVTGRSAFANVDPMAAAFFSQLLTEVTAKVRQELAKKGVAANEQESTKQSIEESMDG